MYFSLWFGCLWTLSCFMTGRNIRKLMLLVGSMYYLDQVKYILNLFGGKLLMLIILDSNFYYFSGIFYVELILFTLLTFLSILLLHTPNNTNWWNSLPPPFSCSIWPNNIDFGCKMRFYRLYKTSWSTICFSELQSNFAWDPKRNLISLLSQSCYLESNDIDLFFGLAHGVTGVLAW